MLKSFGELPLGTRFRYPGHEQIWVIYDHFRRSEHEPMSGKVASYMPVTDKMEPMVFQSHCSHFGGSSECPDMVEVVQDELDKKSVIVRDPDADLWDYYDAMDPGFPDRGGPHAVKEYLRKRKAENKLNYNKLHEFYVKHKDKVWAD